MSGRPDMIWARQFVVFALAAVLVSGIGCAKRKPQLPVQANAPAEPIPSTLPAEISEETPPPEAPALPAELPHIEEPKPQPVKRHRKKPATTPPATQSSSNAPAPAPNTTAVAAAHPPTAETPADTAIAADVPSKELTQQKQTTVQLLETTEKTLDGLPRGLSHDEEEMVTQIRSYVAQSRKATTEGDFERAYNLATKAHLLSDALVKK